MVIQTYGFICGYMGVLFSMTKITFELKEELDTKFRKAIADRKGVYKGVIGEALEEAIHMWIDQEVKKRLRKE